MASVPKSSRSPAIEAEIVMRGRKIGVVVDRHRILTESTWRLDANENVPEG